MFWSTLTSEPAASASDAGACPGHVSTVKVPRTHTKMRDGNWLYAAWWPYYLLEAAQKWIHAFDMQDEFKVKMLAQTDSV